MKIALSTLKTVLRNNVCEVRFQRRRPKPGFPPYRRMLCTNSLTLLSSVEGRLALNYRRAVKRPKFNPDTKNIAITWDIFMQDYRCISVDNCNLIATLPANKKFWPYFNEKLARMSASQKTDFMNR